MGYGLLDAANQTRKEALQGLGEADQLREQREMMNKQMKEQAKMQHKQNIGSGVATGASSGADRAAFRDKYSGQLSMNGITHQSEIQLKNLRKQRDEVYSDPTLTARQQADRVLVIEQNMKKVVDRFNREYRERVGD